MEAWVARWDVLTDPEQAIPVDDSQYAEKYKAQVAEAVELELDKLDPYRGIEFSDDDLGARAERSGSWMSTRDSSQMTLTTRTRALGLKSMT